ncbi:MAG TPA: hypothetical protein VF189_05620 [Patescibacteria group bacterium]
MLKNVAIGVLLLIVIVEGFFIFRYRGEFHAARDQITKMITMPPAGPNARGGGKPITLGKGTDLKSTPLFKFAYQIAPGTISDNSKKVLTGWNVTTDEQADSSTVVTLTPKDSDDQNQSYTIKSGQILYFIEQTPSDDKTDSDKDLNYRDDYGIITDSKGIIQ